MDSHKLGHMLLDGPRLDTRLDQFTPVAGVTVVPEYGPDAPSVPDPQPVGYHIELLPEGLDTPSTPPGVGC